ncbi:TetR/AcrR family transcriptional regulator [Nocardia sp. NPDC058176]|uniref:TetR/AcrR family transcriptional regulator n=1 Tax=Nocardia sp. NPDC058176 TaxID=3346368 RepID=UPI0036DDF16F
MSSGRQRRIDEIGDESRRRLLDAAESLFAERGVERTTFSDVAERAGISRGSIPWHFKNKDGLVMAVVARSIDRFMGAGRYESVPPLAQVLRDYAVWIRGGNNSSAMIFMVLTEAMNSSGAVHEQYQEFLRNQRRDLQRWLRTHRPEGVDPAHATARERATATALNGAAMGIHLQALIDPDDVDLDASLQTFASFIDDHIRDVWAAEPARHGADGDHGPDSDPAVPAAD